MSATTNFNESDHPRDDAGQFTVKEAADAEATLESGPSSINRRGAGTSRTFWADALATMDPDTTSTVPKIDMRIDGVRTMQRAYSGAAGTLRMPSMAAMNRMASSGADTFDVPFQSGNDHGHVAGWARVHRAENGTWSVQVLDDPAHPMSPQMSGYVRRQMSWVMGSDKPSFAMNSVPSMNALINEMSRREGAEAHPLTDSSFIEEAVYDGSTSTMYLTMHGRSYAYHKPRAVYEEMLRAPSIGKFYNQYIKQAGSHSDPADKCDQCGRYVPATEDHDCPNGVIDTPDQADDRAAVSNTAWARTARAVKERVAAGRSAGRVRAPSVTSTRRSDWERSSRALLKGAGKVPSIPRVNLPGMEELGSSSRSTRFAGVSGDVASRLATTSAGAESRTSVGPHLGRTLAAVADDDTLSVSGHVDPTGVSVGGMEYKGASPDADADAAWEEVARRHPGIADRKPTSATWAARSKTWKFGWF